MAIDTPVTNTPFDPERLVRPSLRNIPEYIPAEVPPGRTGRIVKLDMNESPYGPSPKAQEALATFTETHRYPDFQQVELRQALARYTGAPADNIICGAGLDDVLNTLMHAVLEPGDEVVISEPTFGVYRVLVSLYDGKIVDVPLRRADFSLDAAGVLETIEDCSKIIIICTPNNPTGNLLDPAAVERVVAGSHCLVVIDEAYAEFAGRSHLELMERYPNVAICRTMSKFAGLAGMRLGYGIFPSSLMPYLAPVVPAFHNVSMATRVAAIASLSDTEYLQGIIGRIVRSRDELASRLAEIDGVVPLPSATNFLLVRLPVDDAGPVVQELANRGVFVRHFSRPDLEILDCLRVTVGTPEENDIFYNELTAVLASR
jgi:histidinol-phosphate aminotransferase